MSTDASTHDTPTPSGAVVAALDGSHRDDAVIDWAAAEATALLDAATELLARRGAVGGDEAPDRLGPVQRRRPVGGQRHPRGRRPRQRLRVRFGLPDVIAGEPRRPRRPCSASRTSAAQG